ncbi:hypothetical protein HK405_011868, partial [Cladochytrium tenue]
TQGKFGITGLRMVQKGQLTTLLEIRRANNVAIGLSRFTRRNISSADLLRKVSELDDTGMLLEDVVSIQSLLPTPEEKALLEEHVTKTMNSVASDTSNPPPPLAPAEQFMIHCLRVRDLPLRLSALILKMQLPLEAEEMTTKLSLMTEVCSQLRTSETLRTILRTVLQLGNLSNSDFAAGNSSYRPWMGKEARALGFKIDGLARLKDVKSADGKWNLMTFLVDMVQQMRPDVLDFTTAFANLKRVRHFDLYEMASQVLEINDALAKVRGSRFVYEPEEEARDALFHQRLAPLTQTAAATLADIRSQFSQFSLDWAEAARYFGEDLAEYVPVEDILAGQPRPVQAEHAPRPKKPPSHLFNALGLFFQGFEDAVRLGRLRAEEEARRQKRGLLAADGGWRRQSGQGRDPDYISPALAHLQSQRELVQPSRPHPHPHPGYQPPQRHQPGAGVLAALAALSANSNATTAAAAAAAAGLPTRHPTTSSSELSQSNYGAVAAPIVEVSEADSPPSRQAPAAPARPKSTRELLQTREEEAREMMRRFSVMPDLPPEDLAALADEADAAADAAAERAADGSSGRGRRDDDNDGGDDFGDDLDDGDDVTGSSRDDASSRLSGSVAGGSSVLGGGVGDSDRGEFDAGRRRRSDVDAMLCQVCFLPRDECECEF